MTAIINLYNRVSSALSAAGDQWLTGLLARFVFAAVLYGYFLSSAKTKVNEGILGFFSIADGAYYQIALPAVDAAGGDVDAVSFIPWGLVVTAGTYGEFILPLLVIIGLFGRIAALGMIIFVAVQTFVDITVHQVGAETIGALFDRAPDAVIMDQRLLWVFVLSIIVVKGPGLLSVDTLLQRWYAARSTNEKTAPGIPGAA